MITWDHLLCRLALGELLCGRRTPYHPYSWSIGSSGGVDEVADKQVERLLHNGYALNRPQDPAWDTVFIEPVEEKVVAEVKLIYKRTGFGECPVCHERPVGATKERAARHHGYHQGHRGERGCRGTGLPLLRFYPTADDVRASA